MADLRVAALRIAFAAALPVGLTVLFTMATDAGMGGPVAGGRHVIAVVIFFGLLLGPLTIVERFAARTPGGLRAAAAVAVTAAVLLPVAFVQATWTVSALGGQPGQAQASVELAARDPALLVLLALVGGAYFGLASLIYLEWGRPSRTPPALLMAFLALAVWCSLGPWLLVVLFAEQTEVAIARRLRGAAA